MKTVDFNSMKVGFVLESIDVDNKRCELTISSGMKKKLLTDVILSGLLLSRMAGEKSREFYQVGVKYVSDNNEGFRKKNPFQLIRYADKNTGEIRYYLTVVEDAGMRTITRGEDMFGNKMTERVFRPWHKKQYYRRFRDYVKQVEATNEPVTN